MFTWYFIYRVFMVTECWSLHNIYVYSPMLRLHRFVYSLMFTTISLFTHWCLGLHHIVYSLMFMSAKCLCLRLLTDVSSNFIQSLHLTVEHTTRDHQMCWSMPADNKMSFCISKNLVCVGHLLSYSNRAVTSLALICPSSWIAMETLACRGAWTLITPSHRSVICAHT